MAKKKVVGRKPLAEGIDSVSVNIRCTPAQKAKFQALGGSNWFRLTVDSTAADGTMDAVTLARHPAVVAEVSRMLLNSALAPAKLPQEA